MLYYLFNYLEGTIHFPGAGVFQYISFRAAMAVITSLLITMVFGKRLIAFLRKKQVGEIVRDLGLEGQKAKQGTPTMGGLIILGAILIPTLLFAKLNNIYILLMIATTVWLGLIGFLDDYIKVFKKDKRGLAGRFKILGQIILGLVVGFTMYFSNDVVIRERINKKESIINESVSVSTTYTKAELFDKKPVKSLKTTLPFIKGNEADYAKLIAFTGKDYSKWAFLIFIPIIIFIITAVSNGANMTDGLDGLARSESVV